MAKFYHRLTPLQVELLQRIANGERMSRIMILVRGKAISAGAIRMQVSRARGTLAAATIPQAVAIALRENIIR